MAARAARFFANAVATRGLESVTPEIEAVAATNDVFARFLAEGYAAAGVAEGYAAAGVVESAIGWLSVAVDRGYINYPFLARYDPCFERVRTHPRFQQLLETVRERWQSFET